MFKIRNTEEFSQQVEGLVKEKHLTYLEAAIEQLSNIGIDYDSAKVKYLLSPDIQKKIYNEAIELNLFNKKKKK